MRSIILSLLLIGQAQAVSISPVFVSITAPVGTVVKIPFTVKAEPGEFVEFSKINNITEKGDVITEFVSGKQFDVSFPVDTMKEFYVCANLKHSQLRSCSRVSVKPKM